MSYNSPGRNIRRPDGKTPKLWSRHAEENLLQQMNRSGAKVTDFTVLIFRMKYDRTLKDFVFGNAEPCIHCHSLLSQHNVKKVVTIRGHFFEVVPLESYVPTLSKAERLLNTPPTKKVKKVFQRKRKKQ